MKRLSLITLIAILICLPVRARAEYTHALTTTGSSVLTCTNTGGTVGSQYSTDIFIGTLTGSITPTLPTAASNCNPRDHIEIMATQGTNQSYTVSTQAGSGTALRVTSNGGSTLALPVSGGPSDYLLLQIWVYNTAPSTPEWELVTQETYPPTVSISGASAGPGIQISGTAVGTLNVLTGVINVKTDEGALGNGHVHFDGAMTSSSSTLTSAGGGFVSGDVGKLICVAKSNSGSGQTCGTISTYTSATQVALSFTNTSGGSITSAWYDYWSDDLNAFNNGCSALASQGGGTLYVPAGDYGLSGEWNCGANYTVVIQGAGAASAVWGYSGGGTTVNNAKLATYITAATTGLSGPFLKITRDVNGGSNGIYNNVFRTDIRDLTLWGGVGVAQDGGGNEGVNFTDAPWIGMQNVFVGNFKSYNIDTAAGTNDSTPYLDGITLDNVWSMLSGASGYTISGESQNVTIRDSQFDNNKQYGMYLNSPIWQFNMTDTNIQRNNTANAVSTYTQIGINADIKGCHIAGNYYEDDGGNTPVASQSSHWSLCPWEGGDYVSGMNTSGPAGGSFIPTFSGGGATALNTCNISVGFQNHIKQCVSDAAACTNGTTYAAGGGSTSCIVQCNSSALWKETGQGCY